jgi:hypothetical protein
VIFLAGRVDVGVDLPVGDLSLSYPACGLAKTMRSRWEVRGARITHLGSHRAAIWLQQAVGPCRRHRALNDTQTATYAAAGVPVADVGGAFHNDDPVPSAQLVYGWTWFWSFGDTHPNTAGYGVISQALLVGDEGSILVAVIVAQHRRLLLEPGHVPRCVRRLPGQVGAGNSEDEDQKPERGLWIGS